MDDSFSSYLQKLQWKPSLEKGMGAALLTNIRFTLLIIIAILIAGIFGLINLPRRINPEVNIPIVFITTVLPGGSPEDIETLITDPLESAIRGVTGMTRYSSNSQENISTIVLEFESKVNPDKARDEVQSAIDMVTTLPEDINGPRVLRLDFEDVPVITFALTSAGDDISLMSFARDLKSSLEDLPEIENVVISGFEESELTILMHPDKLKDYRLNSTILRQQLTAALAMIPSGTIRAEQSNLPVSVELGEDKLTLIRTLPLTVDQQAVVLGEVADVSIKSKPNQPASFLATTDKAPEKALTFSVFKTAGADLEISAQAAKERITASIDQYPNRFTVYPITDFDKNIDEQFNDLLEDFITSIGLVFLTLLFFLGIRQAAIASFVIPLSFFATFAAMYAFDIELSFLSLFSLLLGLGMIVDDAIVMVSAMTDYYATGKFTPRQTGLLVWRDFLAPTLSSNLTNIWSFLPLLIASGIIGEFTKVISIVVTLALVGSTIIALIVTIPLMIAILKLPRAQEVIKVLKIVAVLVPTILLIYFFRKSPYVGVVIGAYTLFILVIRLNGVAVREHLKARFRRFHLPYLPWRNVLLNGLFDAKAPIARYKQTLMQVLESKPAKRQTLIAVISLALCSYLLVPLGLVKNEFFPKTDEDLIYISITLPAGTSLLTSQAEGYRVLNELRLVPDIEYVLMDIGLGVDMSMRNSSEIDASKIRFSLRLKPEREKSSFALANLIREQFNSYHAGEFQVVEITGGPPSGSDIQLTILGDDLRLLEEYGKKVQAYIKEQPGTANVELSVKPSTSKIRFTPDSNRLRESNLTLPQVGVAIREYTTGSQLSEIALDTPECEDKCPVIFRLNPTSLEANSLPSLMISAPGGKEIPLSALGSFSLTPNPIRIAHEDGSRAITVQGSVLPGFNRVEIGDKALVFAQKGFPMEAGYRWQTGGVNEENNRSVQSILQAMGVAAVLIMGTMVIELRSFKRALIVMMAIPLAVSGVCMLFALTGTPLSFPALIGVLALFGIVVKNSILIVDKINRNLDIGLPFTEAVADGASSRLEPIAFSSMTNIIGLIPITLSDPLWRGLGGAIIAGLTLSGLIMLIFIPVVFDMWYRRRYT